MVIALYWYMHYASTMSSGPRQSARKLAERNQHFARAEAARAEAVRAALPQSNNGESLTMGGGTVEVRSASGSSARRRDVSLDWGPPTLSTKRLIDQSPNYLPVPNAEGPDPDDMTWRKHIPADNLSPCPVGRRPFHTILTAQSSLYQEWQTKCSTLARLPCQPPVTTTTRQHQGFSPTRTQDLLLSLSQGSADWWSMYRDDRLHTATGGQC